MESKHLEFLDQAMSSGSGSSCSSSSCSGSGSSCSVKEIVDKNNHNEEATASVTELPKNSKNVVTKNGDSSCIGQKKTKI